MTDTVVKLRGKLPTDAAIHRDAERLYQQGLGHGGLAVVRWHVDKVEESDAGDGVRISVDQLEVIAGDLETTAKQLMADAIDARGGNAAQLPFDETDRQRYDRMLGEWQQEEGHDDAEVQRLWGQHFNPSEDAELHVTGPVGASPEHLREFLGYVGAIEEATDEAVDDADSND